MTKKKYIQIFITSLLTAALILLGGCQNTLLPAPSQTGSTPAASSSPEGLKVHFIDVGQGDSILAESNGHFMLIDAGENNQGSAVVSYLKNAGVTTLDYVIGTHPHSDHIGGLDDVIDTFDVKKVIMPPIEHTTKTFEDVLDAVADKGLKITMPKTGDQYPLGGASFTVLAPVKDYGDDLNNWSAGIKLSYGHNSFVMCGDGEKEAESDMAGNTLDLSADVLKIGHHGSRTSTSDEFLKKVSPSYGIIQCGVDNSYGHPHKETLEKLEKAGIEVMRTDELGTIIASSDGTAIHWFNLGEGSNPLSIPHPASVQPDTQTDIRDSHTNVSVKGAYVLNTNSKKFHLPDCASVKQISPKNRQDIAEDRETLIRQGCEPCKQCKP